LTIDGRAVTELGFQGAIQHIRGPEGSCIPIGVRRSSQEQVTEIIVCRRRIQG
jgi:C-terminal processing protease CtpA/Prc